MIEDRDTNKHGAEAFRRYVDAWNETGERVTISIVGCGKVKGPERAAAMELYSGDLTRKRIQICDDLAPTDSPYAGTPFLILSAKHGLVGPLAELDPYDATLITVDRAELVERVKRQLHAIGANRLQLMVEAGSAYQSIIEEAVADHPDARVSAGRVTGSVCRAKQRGRRILDMHEEWAAKAALREAA